MLLSAVAPQTLVCNSGTTSVSGNLLVCPTNHKLNSFCRSNGFTQKPLVLTNSSNSLPNNTSQLQNPNPDSKTLRHGSISDSDESEGALVASASAVASAIRRASTSPVDFIQRTEKVEKNGLILPSPDFQRLCLEQLDLFRRIVDPNALLSVYVRPAGSYVMDRLELRRATFYPGVKGADIVILVGNFSIPTGLRVAEAALSNQQAEVIPESRAVVFPMVKHPFVVGFLVAELPVLEDERGRHPLTQCASPEESYVLPPQSDMRLRGIQALDEEPLKSYNFTADQRLNAINISRSLAMAYVMDQKAMLLQQSSWQNNVRMSYLVEQIRGPLSSIRTLSKMLSVHMKRSEIANDIVEDIVVQGDRMTDTLQQLQDAVHLTKANIVRYNEETLMKIHKSTYSEQDSVSHLSDNFWREISSGKKEESGEPLSLASAGMAANDPYMPAPPLALANVSQDGIRPCNVYDILADLVGAVKPLAHKQQRKVELIGYSQTLQVAVEEPALRQALSNLIEGALLRTHVGGRVEILSNGTPAGGVFVVIDDDGPDMHYMTQMHSLTPFGAGLFSEDMVEDNMTWNFVAGLTVACEILESYGCVVHVISPRSTDAALGAGGTRVKIWLPCLDGASDLNGS